MPERYDNRGLLIAARIMRDGDVQLLWGDAATESYEIETYEFARSRQYRPGDSLGQQIVEEFIHAATHRIRPSDKKPYREMFQSTTPDFVPPEEPGRKKRGRPKAAAKPSPSQQPLMPHGDTLPPTGEDSPPKPTKPSIRFG